MAFKLMADTSEAADTPEVEARKERRRVQRVRMRMRGDDEEDAGDEDDVLLRVRS
jgi:hypothetical protein